MDAKRHESNGVHPAALHFRRDFNGAGDRFHLNNSRISDLRADTSHRIAELKELLDAKLARQQEIMLAKFAELGNRLTRIESHLNLK